MPTAAKPKNKYEEVIDAMMRDEVLKKTKRLTTRLIGDEAPAAVPRSSTSTAKPTTSHRMPELQVRSAKRVRELGEVLTAEREVKAMLDLLPASIWNDQKTFFEPACGNGNFLVAILRRKLAKIPQPSARHPQQDVEFEILRALASLYGTDICPQNVEETRQRLRGVITEYWNTHHTSSAFQPLVEDILNLNIQQANALEPGQTLICEWQEGNVVDEQRQHTFHNGRCVECGAPTTGDTTEATPSTETHAYTFIHGNLLPQRLKDMKFNVVITNPPYQLKDGGHGASAQPIYQKFVERAKKMADHVVMIIPARWYAGGKGLDEFRSAMLADTRIRTLVDMPNSEDAFPGVDIAGGICYFHWERNHDGLCNYIQWKGAGTNPKKDGILRKLNEHDILIRDPNAVAILTKVLAKTERFFEETVSSRKPFGLQTNFTDFTNESASTYRCLTKDGFRHVKKSQVNTGRDLIANWKTVCSRADGAASALDESGKQRVLSKSETLTPNEICLETYLVTGTYSNKTEAENAARYLLLKLPRYLLGLRKIDQNISKEKFKWVPLMDFTHPWTDEELYAHFDLKAEEIHTIESSIK